MEFRVLLSSIILSILTACGTLVSVPQDQPTVPMSSTPEEPDAREPESRTFEWPGDPVSTAESPTQIPPMQFDGIPIGISVKEQRSLTELATTYQTTSDKLLAFNPTLSDPVLPGTFVLLPPDSTFDREPADFQVGLTESSLTSLSASGAPLRVSDAVPSVFRIQSLACNGDDLCNSIGVGSGVAVHPKGLVLTAEHVTCQVEEAGECKKYADTYILEETTDPQSEPRSRYWAKLIAFKPDADLALLRIVREYGTNKQVGQLGDNFLSALPLTFDMPEIGDSIRLLGYPTLGAFSGSIQIVIDSISGFAYYNGRLLTMNRTLSPGHSGGPAILERDGHYEVFGVLLNRSGDLENIAGIRDINQLDGLQWVNEEENWHAWIDNVSPYIDGNNLRIEAEVNTIDMKNRGLKLIAYVDDFNSDSELQVRISAPITPVNPAEVRIPVLLETTIFSTHFQPELRLSSLLLQDESDVVYWRSAQTQTIAMQPTETPAPTLTTTLIPTATPTPSEESTVSSITFPPAQEGETLVLVADFVTTDDYASDPREVTRDVVEQMKEVLRDYPDIRVERLGAPLSQEQGSSESEKEKASRIGSDQNINASIVIWGSYIDRDEPELSVYYYLLQPSMVRSEAEFNDRLRFGPGAIQPTMFDFKADLGDFLGGLVAFSSALALDSANRHEQASTLYAIASEASGSPIASEQAAVIRYYQAVNFAYMGESQQAEHEIDDLLDSIDRFSDLYPLILHTKGFLVYKRGNPEEALQILNEAQQGKEVSGYPSGQAVTLSTMGAIYFELGDRVRALDYFRRSLEIWQELGDPVGIMTTRSYIDFVLTSSLTTPNNTSTAIAAPMPTDTPTPTSVAVRASGPFTWTHPLDGAVYAYVPAGKFTMGSTNAQVAASFSLCQSHFSNCEYSWFADEFPQHQVDLNAYWIMVTEVTNAQFRECVEADGACAHPNNQRWNSAQYDDHPVISVSWRQANDYAQWVHARLPTEAEWEKACRSDDGRLYPWGNNSPTGDLANFDFNIGDTTSVNSYPLGRSPYGLVNMSGNGWEWTSSLYQDYLYLANDRREDPTSEDIRAYRNGSWGAAAEDLNCTARAGNYPDYSDLGSSFRLATSEPAAGAIWTNPKDHADYLFVPAGDFTMGSSGQDPLAQQNEKPQHEVYQDGFWIKKTEVTNAEYQRCVNAGACTEPNNSHWQSPMYAAHPVTYISWYDANDYAKWAGGQLPTEAQWEKAARGTDARDYPWGNNSKPDASLLNFNMHIGDTTPVGSYPDGASPYGVMDMAGNTWEWVNDWYAEDYYSVSPTRNPIGPATGEYRVIRGAAWFSTPDLVRVTDRDWGHPTLSFNGVGTRVVITPSP